MGKIYYKELESFLRSLKREDFGSDAKIKAGISISDIERFSMDKSKITLDRVIDYGTPFLVDALGNDLSIVILSRRRYKLPTGRLIEAKYDRTIISDCCSLYGTALKGYWVIPECFFM